MQSFMSRVTRVLIGLVVFILLGVIALFWMGGRQRHYQSRVVIQAPRELVFHFLTDLDTIQRWAGGQSNIQALTDGGHRQGAKSRITTRINGLSLQIESEVLETQPHERLITALTSRQMNARSDFQLDADGDKTVLQHTLLVSPRGWARFYAPFSGEQIQSNLDQGLNNLRQIMETEARQFQQPQLPIE